MPHRYKRAQLRAGDGVRRVARLSGIDACWGFLPTPCLCSRSARGVVLDLVADGAGLSDHAPIGLRLEATPREKQARIPEWIARHARFPEKVKQLTDITLGYGAGDAWEQLQSHIGVLHCVLHLAAAELAKELQRPPPADVGAAWRFHWFTRSEGGAWPSA